MHTALKKSLITLGVAAATALAIAGLCLVAPEIPIGIAYALGDRFSRGRIEIVNQSDYTITMCSISGAGSMTVTDPIPVGQSRQLSFDTRNHARELKVAISLADGTRHTFVRRYFGNLTSIRALVGNRIVEEQILAEGYL